MDIKNYQDWKNYFESRNQKLIPYLNSFKESQFPFIVNLSHFSNLIGIKIPDLLSILNNTSYFYRVFYVEKKSGGKRTISSPYPVLEHIQKWIKSNILEKILINSAATGFVKNKSILDNVYPHLGKKCIIKIDIQNFFPSINQQKVFFVFKNCGYSDDVSVFLAKFCCQNNSLPQGACTSPYLANIIAKKLDTRIYNYAKKMNFAYTRYADDIAISGEKISFYQYKFVQKIITEEGFKINKEKTKLLRNVNQKIITGISLNDKVPKLPRSTKRKLRQDAYVLLKQSKEEYYEKYFRKDPVYLERLIGKFAFWLFIEKENEYVYSTLNKLKEYSVNLSK